MAFIRACIKHVVYWISDLNICCYCTTLFSNVFSFVYVTEARLERIKGTGCSKSQAPKDIIEGLDQIRTAQLHAASTGPDSSMPYLRNCDYITDLSSSSTIIDTVRRKIAPEKQALNEEELRSLIENDELRDKTVLLYSDQPPADVTSPESFDTLNT